MEPLVPMALPWRCGAWPLRRPGSQLEPRCRGSGIQAGYQGKAGFNVSYLTGEACSRSNFTCLKERDTGFHSQNPLMECWALRWSAQRFQAPSAQVGLLGVDSNPNRNERPETYHVGSRAKLPSTVSELSDVLQPLRLKVAFGRQYRFQNVDFSQVMEAPRKVRGRGFSFMCSRKLRGRAAIQSRKQEIVVFLHARKRNRTSIPFLNPRKRRGSDSLFKPLAEGTFHATQAPRKPSRKGFDISLRPQLSLEHCSVVIVHMIQDQGAHSFF